MIHFILLKQNICYRQISKNWYFNSFQFSLASCSLMNFDFLLSHTAHFDKSIVFPVLVFTTFDFFSVFFLSFKQWNNMVFVYSLNFYLLLEFWISSFISKNYFCRLFIKIDSSWLTLESIKVLEITTSMLINLGFAVLSCFYFFFIYYWLIPYNCSNY